MIRSALLLALPLALAACGQSETAPEPTGSVAPGGDLLADALVVVDANGLGAKGVEPLRFGMPREQVDAAFAKAFGAQGEPSHNEECGAGPMEFSQFGPLQVGYLDGRLAGWFLGEGEGVATSDGVVPGLTTLEMLALEHQVQQLDSTLEGAFQYTTGDYGTITGFADPDGTITGLAAGVTCFFR